MCRRIVELFSKISESSTSQTVRFHWSVWTIGKILSIYSCSSATIESIFSSVWKPLLQRLSDLGILAEIIQSDDILPITSTSHLIKKRIYSLIHIWIIYIVNLRHWVHYIDRYWNCVQTGEQLSLSAAYALHYSRSICIYDRNEYIKDQSVIRESIPCHICISMAFSCYLPRLRNLMKFANRGL